MTKVTITGVNGFLGSNLAKKLIANKHQVKGLMRKGSDSSLLPKGFKPTFVDYWDENSLLDSLEGEEVLIHNAAITRGLNQRDFYQQNVVLTEKLIAAANKTDTLKQIIFISSQAAAGMCLNKTAKKENEECKPVTHYGRSKLLAEQRLQELSDKNWTIIRPASVFGGGDRDFLQYFKLVRSGISVLIGHRPKYISLIYVDDLAEMIMKSIGNSKAFNEIFFASCSSFYSWNDFIRELETAIGKKSLRVVIPEFLVYPAALSGEIKGLITKKPTLINLQKIREITGTFWLCDSGKAKNLLEFEESGNLVENLKKTYQWYKEHKWL